VKRIVTLVLAIAVTGLLAPAASATATERSGALHVTKECSHYGLGAGDFCTIRTSNINAIRPDMRVVYASAADLNLGVLDSDLVIDGPGSNNAFGHVVLQLSTLTGVVALSGGTGRFSHLHAQASVACPAFPVCSWDGTYSFAP